MRKIENFEKALKNLKDIFRYEEPYDNVVLTGLVSLFEICFEQAWKAMKEILEEQGYEDAKTGSPKMVIKLAYSANMIGNEEIWLEALVSRNNVSHSYNEGIAIEIVRKTKKMYCHLFEELQTELDKNWK